MAFTRKIKNPSAEVQAPKRNYIPFDEMEKNIERFLNMYDSKIDRLTINSTDEVRKFIDKMAIWYELRFPDYKVKAIIEACAKEGLSVKDIILSPDFKDDLNWNVFYNALSEKERVLIDEEKYPRHIWIDRLTYKAVLSVTPNGTVEKARDMASLGLKDYTDDDFIGKNVVQVLEILKRNRVSLFNRSDITAQIDKYNREKAVRYNIIQSVMCRIMTRGDKNISAKRAFIFASEFDGYTFIPLRYGISMQSKPAEFIKAYLNGSTTRKLSTELYIDNTHSDETMTIEEILKKSKAYPSEEEKELIQDLVDTLSSETAKRMTFNPIKGE